ncbi:DUF1850 domain-containing protein [Halobacterium hubeiense]|uniref:DUF1850 domain-containing protein n=1 Tax=Halobacterium hubeiense TaxID=1407499 RepID=UPI003C785209
MTDRITRRKRVAVALAAVAVVLVALAGGAAALSTGKVLVVEDVDTGERYVTEPVDDGSTVQLQYMHSVEKTPVNDVYRVDGDALVNTRMEFESYGWGLPSRVNVTNVNGTFVYDPAEPIITLDSLSVSPGRIADHTLVVDDRRIDLVAKTNAGDVRIHVERRTITDVLL